MDQRQTIGTVSKNLGISSRMLRYYEQIGLIESKRVENYAYRVYERRGHTEAPSNYFIAETAGICKTDPGAIRQ